MTTNTTEFLAEQKRLAYQESRGATQRRHRLAEGMQAMIAALEAVIGKHRRQDDDDEPYCGTCFQSPYGYAPWPCPTIRAIEAALGGEGE